MVYVDAPIWPYRGMLMCHLMADTEDELHTFAANLGMKRAWFQGKPGKLPHYDICKAKRVVAVRRGAVEVTREKTVELLHRHRQTARGHNKD